MKTREVISRYEEWFPPMYREDQGVSYSFSVFLSRFILLGKVCVALVAAMAAFWFVTDSRDLRGGFLRLLVVAAVGYGAWRVLGVWRQFNREAAERKLNPSADESLRDRKEIAQLVSGAWMLMTVAGSAKVEKPSLDEPAIHRVIKCLVYEKTEGKPFVWSSDKPESMRVVTGCVESAQELQVLVRLSKSRLVLDEGKRRSVVSGTARSLLVEALRRQDVFIEFEPGVRRRPSLKPMIEIIGVASTKGELHYDDPTVAVDSVVNWLESIQVSIADCDSLFWSS